MHIMLVNDDGIHAPGIRALCDAAVAAGHRVSVCAPDCERSAASRAGLSGVALTRFLVASFRAARSDTNAHPLTREAV